MGITFHALLVFVSTVGAAAEEEERTTGNTEAGNQTVRIVVGFEGSCPRSSKGVKREGPNRFRIFPSWRPSVGISEEAVGRSTRLGFKVVNDGPSAQPVELLIDWQYHDAPTKNVPRFASVDEFMPEVRATLLGLLDDQRLDALVFLTIPCPASVAHDREDERYVCDIDDCYRPCYLANTTGNPEITVPAGDVLFVEATTMEGNGNLILTGQLGDVMKESASAALSFIRSHADALSIPDEFFNKHDINIVLEEDAVDFIIEKRVLAELDLDQLYSILTDDFALGLKLVLLSHNTVRGAAGGTLLNAELLAAKDLLPRRSAR